MTSSPRIEDLLAADSFSASELLMLYTHHEYTVPPHSRAAHARQQDAIRQDGQRAIDEMMLPIGNERVRMSSGAWVELVKREGRAA